MENGHRHASGRVQPIHLLHRLTESHIFKIYVEKHSMFSCVLIFIANFFISCRLINFHKSQKMLTVIKLNLLCTLLVILVRLTLGVLLLGVQFLAIVCILGRVFQQWLKYRTIVFGFLMFSKLWYHSKTRYKSVLSWLVVLGCTFKLPSLDYILD